MGPPQSSTAVSAAQRLEAAKQRVVDDLRASKSGSEICLAYSGQVEAIAAELAANALAQAEDDSGPVAVAAFGGLGRKQLAPYADLDLAVLCNTQLSEGTPAFDAIVRTLVHPLWDLGLKANLVVHDAQTWLDEAEHDLPSCTALLDLRTLAGRDDAVAQLRRRGAQRFFGAERESFLHRLEDETAERHGRFGGTVFLVEPDLKYGPGGLRDLAASGWALAATHGTDDLDALVRDEKVPPGMAAALMHARDCLLRFRAALQIVAARPQDRLVFQYQESLAPMLAPIGPEPDDEALVRGIEALMQEYYRAASTVVRYGGRLRQRCLPEHGPEPATPKRLDERFSIVRNRLRHANVSFEETPVLALEALRLARDHGVELSGETYDAIAEAVAAGAADGLEVEPQAQHRMLDLLAEPEDMGTPPAFELCHELGLLERVVPELGPIRGRMQHDTYHVYTVDQHTLSAIALLKRLCRGEHNKDYPLATALHLEIDDPRTLYLATLVHDAGKARQGDQCEVGAEIAEEVAKRAGLPDAEVQRCVTLVREHLTMPLLSQKRDLGDPLLVGDFARRIGDRSTLQQLYLLSMADTASVRPGNLTSWKLTLLDELYLLASAQLRRGAAPARRAFSRAGEPAEMPERYYSLYHLDLRLRHGEMVQRLLDEERAALLALEPGSGALRLTLVARDRPGLLAQTAALLDDQDIEVLAADVFSSPGPPAVVLDVFRVAAKEGPERGVDVETVTELEQALQTGVERSALDTAPPPRRSPPWRKRPSVPTSIVFDRDQAGERTIVEIETAAGTEVLRRVTRAFAAEGIEILLARCNTEADRATNVFYVPTLDHEAQLALTERLQTYLS